MPDEARRLLQSPVVVEEKVDGANLGFSLGEDGELRAQNRGSLLQQPFGGQFAPLHTWLDRHQDALFDALEPHLIVFGEWCTARHSLAYDALPDWWLLFDVYDRKEHKFWSTSRRTQWAEAAGFASVPILFKGKATMLQLREKPESSVSCFREGALEGLVLRRENELWLLERAKLVRRDFTQGISTHWSRRAVEWNRLAT